MRSVVEIGASVPAFLGKLWKLVNDSETNHLISWSPGGKTFFIKNQADFARDLLPLYYKHNNMASFIRQLNMYGFHKITSVENGGLRYDKDEIEFTHPCFMKGHPYLLEHIKRKIANPKSIVASNENGDKLVKLEMMNKLLSDVKSMKGKQESMDAKFSAVKQENEALWREVAILRQKHIKQQQIVNNLIQFLCNLVQPGRSSNPNTNNVGVKRPYQLMINNAAHNSGTDGSYPGKLKNIKLDKEVLLDESTEENMEDGPTIHELVHDDLHCDLPQDHFMAGEYVVPATTITAQSPTDPTAQIHYHVTMEDGDDHDIAARLAYPVTRINGAGSEELPIVSTPSPQPQQVPGMSPIYSTTNVKILPTTSKVKSKGKLATKKTMPSLSSFSLMNPPADPKLPADIFASDDSVSDAGMPANDDITDVFHDLAGEAEVTNTKDKMLGGINIKLEKPESPKHRKRREEGLNLNLADIKTELQEDIDWNNMTLATLSPNNNVSRISRNRRDNNNKREDYSSLYGTTPNKNELDDHLESMQTDLESLRELLRSDSYSLDTNTLMGNADSRLGSQKSLHHHSPLDYLFGGEDPFYGLSFNNPTDERANKANNGKKQKGGFNSSGDDKVPLCTDDNDDDVEGNQLISYTGNIPDFEDISIPDLECDNSQDGYISPIPSGSTLHTPQVQLSPPPYSLQP